MRCEGSEKTGIYRGSTQPIELTTHRSCLSLVVPRSVRPPFLRHSRARVAAERVTTVTRETCRYARSLGSLSSHSRRERVE